MAKLLKNMGAAFLVLGIIGSIVIANGFTTGGFNFSVFLASSLTVLVFCVLIYAAGSALETLETIRDNVSMIHKAMSNTEKEHTPRPAPLNSSGIRAESKSTDSDSEDSSTLWKCKNCGTLNPKINQRCYKCNQYHWT